MYNSSSDLYRLIHWQHYYKIIPALLRLYIGLRRGQKREEGYAVITGERWHNTVSAANLCYPDTRCVFFLRYSGNYHPFRGSLVPFCPFSVTLWQLHFKILNLKCFCPNCYIIQFLTRFPKQNNPQNYFYLASKNVFKRIFLNDLTISCAMWIG